MSGGGEDWGPLSVTADLLHYNTGKVSPSVPHSHIPPLTALLKLSQYFQLWLITGPDLQIGDMACLDPLDWPSPVEVVTMHSADIWKNKKILVFSFILKRNSKIGGAWSCSHIPNYQTFIDILLSGRSILIWPSVNNQSGIQISNNY